VEPGAGTSTAIGTSYLPLPQFWMYPALDCFWTTAELLSLFPMSQITTTKILFVLTGLFALMDLGALFWRRLPRDVPWFTTYLFVVVIKQIAGGYLFFNEMWVAVKYTTWAFAAIVLVLGSMVMFESMGIALAEYPTVRGWGKKALIAIGIASVIAAACFVPYGIRESDSFMLAVNLAMRSARMVQLAMLIGFFGFATYLGLAFRGLQFGVLLGFGLYLTVTLSCYALRLYRGTSVAFAIVVIDCVGYFLVMLLWLRYIVREKPHQARPLPPSAGSELEEWNRALEWQSR
jgi:hypothetical protein